MSITPYDPSMFLDILPEIAIVVLMGLVLVFDAVWDDDQRRNLGWLTFGGILVILFLSIFVARPSSEGELIFGGMLRNDGLAYVLRLLFLFGAAITALLGMDMPNLGRRGEFYVLLLASTLGMILMASAADIIMLFLAIETTTIPLYILAGFFVRDDKSTESGFKYLLFGAMTSAISLYGFSLLFGFSGQTNMYAIAQGLQAGTVPTYSVLVAMLLILVGFGFKISVAPLQFWAPDVYEGAPTPVAGFLSTASKAAGFIVLMRFFVVVFPGIEQYWTVIIAVLAAVTMTVGNLLALAQRNIKRLLAYSSIAHAGYALVGVVAVSELGVNSVVFYLGAYLLTNLAAFGAAAAYYRVVGSDDIAAYAGLSRRKPSLAIVMLIAFLSLAGMPPFVGFVSKVVVFAAAVEAGYVWLVVVGVLNSIVGLYYYLKVLNVVYHYRSEDEQKPLPIPTPFAIALFLLVAGILIVGTLFGPFFTIGTSAAASLF
ncbi:MAG: NADH-quinone oxidoreductase subunit N [Anaerolineales bacterium]